jgi:hypothetical protein
MSQPQPPDQARAETQLPLRPHPTPADISFPLRPPSPQKTGCIESDCAATLEWLEARLETIYLAGRRSPHQDGPPKLAGIADLDMYNTAHDYCEAAGQDCRGREPPRVDDLYHCLRNTLITHCAEIWMCLFLRLPWRGSRVDRARRLIGEYLDHWDMLAHLSTLITNVLQHLEGGWIKKSVGEGRSDIFAIKDLHKVMWKEGVFCVGEVLADIARNEMDQAVELLQSQGEGGIQSDKDLIERYLESLRALGLAAVMAIR